MATAQRITSSETDDVTVDHTPAESNAIQAEGPVIGWRTSVGDEHASPFSTPFAGRIEAPGRVPPGKRRRLPAGQSVAASSIVAAWMSTIDSRSAQYPPPHTIATGSPAPRVASSTIRSRSRSPAFVSRSRPSRSPS